MGSPAGPAPAYLGGPSRPLLLPCNPSTQWACHSTAELAHLGFPLPTASVHKLTRLRHSTGLVDTCRFHFPLTASHTTGRDLLPQMLNLVFSSPEDLALGH